MSVKTDRLAALLPDAYGATDSESLLFRLLDVVGAELTAADAKVKHLLKSHWVDYAEGEALDGLAAIYRVERRRRPDGELETDAAFRSRLRSIVPLFTGGGTVRAVRGAVQSVLGLPFDFTVLGLPAGLEADLERLVVLDEFPLTAEQVGFEPTRAVLEAAQDGGQEAVIYADLVARAEAPSAPQIELTIVSGGALHLSLELLGGLPRTGVRTGRLTPPLPPGSVVRIGNDAQGGFSAKLADGTDISPSFVGLDGQKPVLPLVPTKPSRWRFAAGGARFDEALFDDGAPPYFDQPGLGVGLSWLREQPLTFALTVPWSPQTAVERIRAIHGYAGQVFVFAGLGVAAVEQAVDQTRAAGVRANLHFSVFATEDHDVREALTVGVRQPAEDAGASDALRIDAANVRQELHNASDAFAIAGDFEVATFDGPFVFT